MTIKDFVVPQVDIRCIRPVGEPKLSNLHFPDSSFEAVQNATQIVMAGLQIG